MLRIPGIRATNVNSRGAPAVIIIAVGNSLLTRTSLIAISPKPDFQVDHLYAIGKGAACKPARQE
jgi:hypothetical protein